MAKKSFAPVPKNIESLFAALIDRIKVGGLGQTVQHRASKTIEAKLASYCSDLTKERGAQSVVPVAPQGHRGTVCCCTNCTWMSLRCCALAIAASPTCCARWMSLSVLSAVVGRKTPHHRPEHARLPRWL